MRSRPNDGVSRASTIAPSYTFHTNTVSAQTVSRIISFQRSAAYWHAAPPTTTPIAMGFRLCHMLPAAAEKRGNLREKKSRTRPRTITPQSCNTLRKGKLPACKPACH